jgi:DNA-binding NarL/FixJ family response regulator
MPQPLYVVDLTPEERGTLDALLQKGKTSARTLRRAQTLLLAADGWTDTAIAPALHLGRATVEWTR